MNNEHIEKLWIFPKKKCCNVVLNIFSWKLVILLHTCIFTNKKIQVKFKIEKSVFFSKKNECGVNVSYLEMKVFTQRERSHNDDASNCGYCYLCFVFVLFQLDSPVGKMIYSRIQTKRCEIKGYKKVFVGKRGKHVF